MAAHPIPPGGRGAGYAVAALVCGLVGVFLGLIPIVFFLGWLLGVLAIVFGVVGLKSPRSAMAGWGLGLGVLGLLTGVVGLLLSIALFEEEVGGEGSGESGKVLRPGETATLSGDYTGDMTVRLKVTYLGAAYRDPPPDSVATSTEERNKEWADYASEFATRVSSSETTPSTTSPSLTQEKRAITTNRSLLSMYPAVGLSG